MHAGSLTLAWDPPTDTVTTGYRLSYGKLSGQYSTHLDVGLVSSRRVDGLADGTTYCFAVRAYNASGQLSGYSTEVCGKTAEAAPPADDPTGEEPLPQDSIVAGDIVMYAAKAAIYKGHWAPASSAGAAGGRAMRSTNGGWATTNAPLASPSNYFELTFTAAANTAYTVWLRLRAGSNSKWNDSVWVQFSDAMAAGRAVYRIGSTSGLLVNLERCNNCGTAGWGWQNSSYWLTQPTTVTFSSSGTHTIRVQTREDGVEIDQMVLSPSNYRTVSPGQLTNDGKILTETATSGVPPPAEPIDDSAAPPPEPTVNGDIVLYASKAPRFRGHWAASSSSGAAGGRAMRSANTGWAATAAPLAAPANYFEMTFTAPANVPYTLWLRMRAADDSKWNDSVWVQFSDALSGGRAVHRIGTSNGLLVNLDPCETCRSAGWGWQNTSYWMPQVTTVTFASSGTHTIRVQTREDGVEIDQVVLSPSTYRATSPGQVTFDATILAETATSGSTSASATTSALIREIVLYASDATAVRGRWTLTATSDAAGGRSLRSANDGWATTDAPQTQPSHYFEMPFDATAKTPYRVWLRLRAGANSKWNDSVWVQFSDSLVNGVARYRTDSSSALLVNLERCNSCGTSGWGWQNAAYWIPQQSIVTFPTSGTKRIRVQTREDGVEIDQIVLSAVEYLSTPPGPLINDRTIVPKH